MTDDEEREMFRKMYLAPFLSMTADVMASIAAGEHEGLGFLDALKRSEKGAAVRCQRILKAAVWARGHWIEPDPHEVLKCGLYGTPKRDALAHVMENEVAWIDATDVTLVKWSDFCAICKQHGVKLWSEPYPPLANPGVDEHE